MEELTVIRRSSPPLHYTPSHAPIVSETVTSEIALLFGPGYGPLAHFACTHNRLGGRLYATSDAVLFYSSLLGFEKRIKLLLRDIRSLDLCRTTSIELSLHDGEIFTFRSFADREHVLRVLQTIKARDGEKRGGDGEKQSALLLRTPPRGAALPRQYSDMGSPPGTPASSINACITTPILPLISSDDESLDSVATPLHSNRHRCASDSNVTRTVTEPDSPVSSEQTEAINTAALESINEPGLAALKPVEDIEQSWKQAWEMKHAIGGDNPGVESIILHCTLQAFFDLFLADNAPFSLDRFQREETGDRDIHLEQWAECGEGVLSRKMTFVHPLKGTGGIGATEAKTSREQRLRWYGNLGLTLENTTNVEGVPSADAFFIRDYWLVKAIPGEEQVQFQTCFGTHFHKRAIFKSFIEKSVASQTKQWFQGYARMLQQAIQGETIQQDVAFVEEKAQLLDYGEIKGQADMLLKVSDKLLCLGILGAIVLLVGAVMLAQQWFALRETIISLSMEIADLKREVASLAHTLSETA
jgi:hypothetical protein